MFDKSKALFEKACKIIPGGVNSPVRFFQPHPFYVESGDGSKVFTKEGNMLIDYCMGYGAVFLGHNNKEITLEVKNQLDKGNLISRTKYQSNPRSRNGKNNKYRSRSKYAFNQTSKSIYKKDKNNKI